MILDVENHSTDLGQLNKFYRQLAHEGRTDETGNLKTSVNEMNKRWEGLSERCKAALRRLEHLIHLKDDFDANHRALEIWLTGIRETLEDSERTNNSALVKVRLCTNVLFQIKVVIEYSNFDLLGLMKG